MIVAGSIIMNNAAHIICPYCGKSAEGSEEHVIPHSLGGALKSYKICCERCNNRMGEVIDAPFVQMFDVLRAKMRRLNGCGKYTGPYSVILAPLHGKNIIYSGVVKNGKVSSPELSRELKCSNKELNLSDRDIISVTFDWNNQAFVNGLAKIAYGFALEHGLPSAQLKHGVHTCLTSEGNLDKVNFSFPIVPFYPLNAFDEFVELETKCVLYHHLLLFVQGAKLWCYIDLFNTFQFYVLLSDSFQLGKMSTAEHFQFAESKDRSIPEFPRFRSPKDIHIDAMTYGVEPTLDEAELNKRIINAIMTKSVVVSSEAFLKDKLDEFAAHIRLEIKTNSCLQKLQSGTSNVQLYFDQEDTVRIDTYRQLFVACDGSHKSYPDEDYARYSSSRDAVNEYGHKKFFRLWDCLIAQ